MLLASEDLEILLKSKDQELKDPMVSGVFVDNELKWGVKWLIKFRSIYKWHGKSAGETVYLEKIKEKYKNINELNKAWATSFDDWDVLKNDRVIPEAAADMREL